MVFATDVGAFVGVSVIIEEITVVSGWISYVPLGNFVHKVKAIWDFSSLYFEINSFADNFSLWIRSKIRWNTFCA